MTQADPGADSGACCPIATRSMIADLAIEQHPGAGRLEMFVAHATGFSKEVYRPLIHELIDGGFTGPIVAWDSRGHGDSLRGEAPYDWWDFGRDALSVHAGCSSPAAVGIGHSMGGAALVMAELLKPGTFSALVLIEPIVFPPPYGRVDHPLVVGALRRRMAFAGRSEARANFEGKPAFSGWEARALDAYVGGCFEDLNGGWQLKCLPEIEADVFRGGSAHGAYERLNEIAVPVSLVAGADSTTHDRRFLKDLAGRIRRASVTTIDGAGHFVPMEKPGVLAAHINGFVES